MKTIKSIYSVLLSGLLVITGCSDLGVIPLIDTLSYAEINTTTSEPIVAPPSGSSSISGLSLNTSQGSYNTQQKALTINQGDTITVQLDMKKPSMVQVAIEALQSASPGSFDIYVNNIKGTIDVDLAAQYGSGPNNSYLFGLYQIDRSQVNVGSNSIMLICTTGDINLTNIKFLPRDIYSENGNLATTIYTQFGATNQVTGAANPLWTRAYGLSQEIEMIPGPTLYFNPGDLVSIYMVNRLNQDSSHLLATFEQIQGDSLYVDEELAPAALRGEINIPHNFNNTNLHVHGLHVDPSKDDVTIVIVPEGASADGYDAPHSGHPVSQLDSLNEYSVADQSVKPGIWNYQYKIPPIHLPGTHWFHPHKHGATSAQVENGLAGTLVIQDALDNSLVPFTSQDAMNTWRDENDLVFSIQEVTNYLQFGQGDSEGAAIADPLKKIDLTVNGISDFKFSSDKGALQRWRLVNAGTNHRAFSHVWLGKFIRQDTITLNGGTKVVPIYQSTPIYLAAADGITLPQLYKVTAGKPALLAPGNRSDFLVQLDEPGDYVLFKNYSLTTGIIIQDESGNTIYNSVTGLPAFYPAQTNGKNNPYFFSKTGTGSVNYEGFKKKWTKNTTGDLDMAPVIQTTVVNEQFLDVKFATVDDFKAGNTGWQPVTTGGQITNGKLFDVTVTDTLATNVPSMPTTDYLETISAVGLADNAPSYVSTIDPKKDVLQSRPVVFDVSGISVNITKDEGGTTKTGEKNVNQFTLNGRFFILNDPIGNTRSDSLIQRSYQDPKDLEYEKDTSAIADDVSLSFVKSGGVIWNNTNNIGSDYYFTNPGYYQPLSGNDTNGWTWDTTQGSIPSWAALTGIPDLPGGQRSAIINKESKFYTANQGNLPNLPLATTAEEWILINNSDVSHPFHIHINPFFVVEVGQLSYEQGDWYMRAVTADTETQRPDMPTSGAVPGTVYKGEIGVDGIVGNWWDTIIIPAHGYVKVRYWFNVPNQTDSGGVINVTDDYNKVGIWVYHCHILRHEDRGMMMPVITQKTK